MLSLFAHFWRHILVSDFDVTHYSIQSLWLPVQHYELFLPLKCGKNIWKLPILAFLGHVFVIFRCLIGPLVAIWGHILVEEVLSFESFYMIMINFTKSLINRSFWCSKTFSQNFTIFKKTNWLIPPSVTAFRQKYVQ